MKISKKRIYLDIDGVLLDYRTGQPAEHAQTLIDFITSGRYDVYWLTTHCKGDSTQTMEHLSRHFSGRTLKKLGKIKATEWDTLKTEAIDPGSDFIWIDDYPFQAEIAELDAIRRRDSLCRVNLCREDELLNVISFIKNHGRNPSGVPHRRPRWKIYALAAVLLLACLFIYREARPFIWRMVNRPGDRMETHVLHAGRGDLLDTDGNVIATSRTVYDIHFDCCMIESEAEWNEMSRMLAQEIATIFPERAAPHWWDYFQKGRKNRRRHVPIAKDIGLSMADTLRTLTLFSRGKRGGFICTSRHTHTESWAEEQSVHGTEAQASTCSVRSWLWTGHYEERTDTSGRRPDAGGEGMYNGQSKRRIGLTERTFTPPCAWLTRPWPTPSCDRRWRAMKTLQADA